MPSYWIERRCMCLLKHLEPWSKSSCSVFLRRTVELLRYYRTIMNRVCREWLKNERNIKVKRKFCVCKYLFVGKIWRISSLVQVNRNAAVSGITTFYLHYLYPNNFPQVYNCHSNTAVNSGHLQRCIEMCNLYGILNLTF